VYRATLALASAGPATEATFPADLTRTFKFGMAALSTESAVRPLPSKPPTIVV
jgi:hypothetical protein